MTIYQPAFTTTDRKALIDVRSLTHLNPLPTCGACGETWISPSYPIMSKFGTLGRVYALFIRASYHAGAPSSYHHQARFKQSGYHHPSRRRAYTFLDSSDFSRSAVDQGYLRHCRGSDHTELPDCHFVGFWYGP